MYDMYDCSKHFYFFGGLCENSSPGIESSTSQLLALSSIQDTGYFRDVGGFVASSERAVPNSSAVIRAFSSSPVNYRLKTKRQMQPFPCQ